MLYACHFTPSVLVALYVWQTSQILVDVAWPVESSPKSDAPSVALVKVTLLPGIFPFEVSGTTMVCWTLLIFVVVRKWQVSQVNWPYLPPVIPHPPSDTQAVEPVSVLLCTSPA
jgi:hypothetical protein